jgi:hypothetical protein
MFAILKSPPGPEFDFGRAQIVSVAATKASADANLTGEPPDDSWFAVARVDVQHQQRIRPEGMAAAEFWARDKPTRENHV